MVKCIFVVACEVFVSFIVGIDKLYIEGRVAKPVRQDSGYNERSKLGLLQQVSSMSDTYMVGFT